MAPVVKETVAFPFLRAIGGKQSRMNPRFPAEYQESILRAVAICQRLSDNRQPW